MLGGDDAPTDPDLAELPAAGAEALAEEQAAESEETAPPTPEEADALPEGTAPPTGDGGQPEPVPEPQMIPKARLDEALDRGRKATDAGKKAAALYYSRQGS